MTDPAEWLDDYWARCQYDDDLLNEANLDDYWARCQYDDDLLNEANLELSMLRNTEGDSLG